MGYRLDDPDDPEADLRRAAAEQLDQALGEATDADLAAGRRVHQVRKRCKKVRGLLRLFRGSFDAYGDENRRLRDLARSLSAIRDADVRVQTLDEALEGVDDAGRMGELRARMQAKRESALSEAEDRLERAATELRRAREEARSWSLDRSDGDERDPFAAVHDGLVRTYRRGRAAMAAAIDEPTPERLHEWRKRVKYHWYHLRLLEPAWPEALAPQRKAADALGSLLGDDHDFAVLRRAIGDELDALDDVTRAAMLPDAVYRRIDDHRVELQARARRLGRLVFAERPRNLAERLAGYWSAWRAS